jgi:HSP20 family protein
MAEPATKAVPVKTGETPTLRDWSPIESLRREMSNLLENFDRGYVRSPFRRSIFDVEPLLGRELTWASTPAVDIVEKDKAYEVTAELPGMDESNIEVKVVNGMLTIKGEKKEEKEEKKKDYYLSERRYGSFERRFQVPEGVDSNKIEANFKKGVLTVTLPKTVEAQAAEKKIAVKAG